MTPFTPLIEALRSVAIDPTSFNHAIGIARGAKDKDRQIFFIGNGGSAAIASHMTADYLKNARVRAQCFNDPALVTCLANDLGYEHAFDFPLSMLGNSGDVLFAISSSGQSPSITNAVKSARKKGMATITLSGFTTTNPLRSLGDVNFYVPSDKYGTVEVCHHAICHAILDAVIDAK